MVKLKETGSLSEWPPSHPVNESAVNKAESELGRWQVKLKFAIKRD